MNQIGNPIRRFRGYSTFCYRVLSVFAFTPCLFCLATAFASETFYIGPTDSNWMLGSNWDAGIPPRPEDSPTIGGFIPSRSGNVRVNFDGSYGDTKQYAIGDLKLDESTTSGSVILAQNPGSQLYYVNEEIGFTSRGSTHYQAGGVAGTVRDIGVASLLIGVPPHGTGHYVLAGGTLNAGQVQIADQPGTVGSFVQTGGDSTFGYLSVGYNRVDGKGGKASLTLTGGTLTIQASFSGTGFTSTFVQTGGTLHEYGQPFGLDGESTVSGGEFIGDNGISNGGVLTISGAPVLTAPTFVNGGPNAVLRLNDAMVTFPSDFSTDGAVLGAKSYARFETATITTSGFVQAGADTTLDVSRNLTNESTNSAFDMSSAKLHLAGPGVTHRVTWPGTDRGASAIGYEDNFAVGNLSLEANTSAALIRADTSKQGAIYTRILQLGGGVGQIANISSDNVSIYYEGKHPSNAYLEEKTYQLNGGGMVAPAPVQRNAELGNISTRGNVGVGNDVLIGGFIVTGNRPRSIAIRAIGPSLSLNGKPVTGRLMNPTLSLYDSAGRPLGFNDDWNQADADLIAEQAISPGDSRESVLIRTLAPGAYTAVVRGAGDSTGLGLVEVYDLDITSAATVANISTRGVVQSGDAVMIAGFIVVTAPQKVLVRAIGPSLPLTNDLPDPVLELHSADGTLLATNDDWRDTQEAEIEATNVPPSNNFESAILRTLPPGSYTAILRGKGSPGAALVEVYNLQ